MSAIANEASAGNMASNVDGSSDPLQYKILALTFNQDCTALAMGTVKSYSLFTINQDSKAEEIHDCAYEEVRIIERLFSSALIAIVSSQAPRKLKVCHFKKGSEICSYSFANTILAVKLNRSRLVVCLEESIWIHDMRDLKVLHTIRELPSNNDGLCALSPNNDNPYLAYPGSAITGEIQIFDTNNLKQGVTINAHDGPLAAMCFDMSGTRIATSSNKGTVIRIHSPIDGVCLFEFRRGVRRVATIYSLAFSPDSMFLAASSSTETIHIFRLMKQKEKPTEEASTWMGSFGRMLENAAYYLPKQTSEILTQDRSFATVHLQSAGIRTTIAMNVSNKTLKLFVANYDGLVSIYEVNTTDGGECRQISQYLLFNMSQNPKNEQTSPIGAGRDESGRTYPSNLLRNENNILLPHSSVLTNERQYSNQSFNTAIEGHSLPPLSSTLQSDNE
jgi:autophagy-related protein 18